MKLMMIAIGDDLADFDDLLSENDNQLMPKKDFKKLNRKSNIIIFFMHVSVVQSSRSKDLDDLFNQWL